MILIIKHIPVEGPGTLEEFFKETAWQIKIIDLSKGDLLSSLAECEAIISLGGPMNVYETEKYPFLEVEEDFFRAALAEEIPILGICLGAQLLAKACGTEVKKAKEEIGWCKINLTKKGREDPLFSAVDGSVFVKQTGVFGGKDSGSDLVVFQWHEDAFELPEKAKLLAVSDVCENQAFRIGKNAYGLQFHIEITDAMIEDWTQDYIKSTDSNLQLKAKQMLIDYYKLKEKYNRQAKIIYLNFSKIIALNAIAV